MGLGRDSSSVSTGMTPTPGGGGQLGIFVPLSVEAQGPSSWPPQHCVRARLRRILAGWPAHPSDLPGKAGTITLAAFGWAQVSTKGRADWGRELNPHIPMRGACQRICVHTESSALILSLKNFDIYSLTFTELIPQDSVAGSGRAQWTGCNHTHFTDEATRTCQGLRPSERAGTSPVGSS